MYVGDLASRTLVVWVFQRFGHVRVRVFDGAENSGLLHAEVDSITLDLTLRVFQGFDEGVGHGARLDAVLVLIRVGHVRRELLRCDIGG